MTTNLKIRRIRARAVLAPFKRPPVSASGHIPSAPLVLIDLETHGGVTGRAYLFGISPWTLKSIVGCVDGLAEMIKGDVLAPLALEAKLASTARCSIPLDSSVSRSRGSTWRRGMRLRSRWVCRS